mgnify:CR=1 FL=1
MFYNVHPDSLGLNGIRPACCLSQYFFEERVDGLFRVCVIGGDDVDHKHRRYGVKFFTARGS